MVMIPKQWNKYPSNTEMSKSLYHALHTQKKKREKKGKTCHSVTNQSHDTANYVVSPLWPRGIVKAAYSVHRPGGATGGPSLETTLKYTLRSSNLHLLKPFESKSFL